MADYYYIGEGLQNQNTYKQNVRMFKKKMNMITDSRFHVKINSKLKTTAVIKDNVLKYN